MSATAPRSEALPMLWVSSFSPPDLFVAEALRFPALRSARALRRKPNTGTEGIEVSTWDMGALLTWPDYILDNYPTNITLKTHLPQNNISGPKQELDNGKAGNELCSEGKVQIWGQHAVCHGVLSLCHQLRGGDSETRQPEWNNFPSAPPLPTTPPGPCESILINLSVSWSRPEQARESRFSTALPIFSFNPEESWPEVVTTSLMKAFHWNRFILVLHSQTFSSGAHSVDCTQHRS